MSSCCSWRRDPSEISGVTQLNASWLREEGLLSAASSPASSQNLSIYYVVVTVVPFFTRLTSGCRGFQ